MGHGGVGLQVKKKHRPMGPVLELMCTAAVVLGTSAGCARSQVADGAFAAQAGFGAGGFEAVAFAGILAFASVFSGFAVAVAFAFVDVVAMHFVVGRNGFAHGAFGGIGSTSGRGQCHGTSGEQESGCGFEGHEILLSEYADSCTMRL
jgi:hypothetical protein